MSAKTLSKIEDGFKKLDKIEIAIEKARGKAGNVRPNDLARIAKKLGRIRMKKRNREPTYRSELFDTNVVTIPDHPGALGKGITIQIIKQLESDVFLFKEKLIDERNLIKNEKNEVAK